MYAGRSTTMAQSEAARELDQEIAAKAAGCRLADAGFDAGETECIYCGRAVIEHDVPAVDDDEAWEDLRLAHAPGCEWIVTRAHRIDA
jgi:hypothetical protein